MNTDIINNMSNDLNISSKQVRNVLTLLQDGNTVPFIARYRKEVTGGLDEEIIRKIEEVYLYQVNLLKRKEDVIRLIDEKKLLTPELKSSIMSALKLVEVEDLYRPFKEKRKTKASEAIKMGLEDLAKIIMSFPLEGTLEGISHRFLSDKVTSTEMAINNSLFIISEWFSDNAYYAKYIRNYIFNNGKVVSKLKKGANDLNKVYEMYYDFNDDIKTIKSYRVLALDRGEEVNILNVSLEYNKDYLIKYMENEIIKNNNSFVCSCVKDAIKDSLNRLILPRIEREIRTEMKDKATLVAIDNFSHNLEKLLLTPPIADKCVLGLDPAFRTGCKLAVVDKTGKVLKIAVIYPNEPQKDIIGSKKVVLELINEYNVDIIAIGNGTASRESETFIVNVLKECSRHVEYIMVSEAGASVYSASKLAISEFPDLTVEKRSAISIARRLQDSLAELVKIDPKSIGVGLYQHDVNQKELDASLDFVVSKVVNEVGVNINTASESLLNYVSGLTKKCIKDIIKRRDSIGEFLSREDLLKIKTITPKIYEQAIGFIRILNGSNVLDNTSIHPESYEIALKILSMMDCKASDIGKEKLLVKLKNVDEQVLASELKSDKYTIKDIIESLKNPGRDPRDNMTKPILRSDILHIEDLKIGEKIQGTVRNVVDFGAFVDIGLKNDGMIHISKMSHDYIKHPSEVLSVGDIVECYVVDISLEKKRVSLSLLKEE